MMDDEFSPYDIAGRKPEEAKRERVAESFEAGSTAAHELRAFIERMERLAEEKSAVADDEKVVMAEAKSRGFDNKAIRTILRMRKQDPAKLVNEQTVLDTYLAALNMLGDA